MLGEVMLKSVLSVTVQARLKNRAILPLLALEPKKLATDALVMDGLQYMTPNFFCYGCITARVPTLIEEYLKKKAAVSAANSNDVLHALMGEEVEEVLFVLGTEGINYTLVFKSGTSFAFNCRGAFWITSSSETRKIIEAEIDKNKRTHDQYHALHKLLGIAL